MLPEDRSRFPWPALAAVACLALAGCGGGGGGDASPTPPPGNIDLSAANQDAVARSASIALLGGLVAEAGGLTGAGGTLSSVRRIAMEPPRRSGAGLIDLSGACSGSGSINASLDDRDNSLSVTPGDVLSVEFVGCLDAGSIEVIDGRLTATYTSVSGTPPTAVVANVVLTDLRSVSTLSTRSAVYNGDFVLDHAETSASTWRTHVTAGQALVLRVVHPLYQDTIAPQRGYRVTLWGDLATPPGAPGGGRTMIEAVGRVASASAGGIFSVWSQPPGLDLWDAEAYPRSGQVLLQGIASSIMLTVLSESTVRVELDADGNGSFESTKDMLWEWLI